MQKMSAEMGCQKVELIRHGGGAMNAMWTLSSPHACYFKLPKKKLGGGSLWDFSASACLFHEANKPATNIHGEKLDLNRADSTFMNHQGVLYSSKKEISLAIQDFYASL